MLSHLKAWKPVEGKEDARVCCKTCRFGFDNSGIKCEKESCVPDLIPKLAEHLKNSPNYSRGRLTARAKGMFDAETARRVIRYIEDE